MAPFGLLSTVPLVPLNEKRATGRGTSENTNNNTLLASKMLLNKIELLLILNLVIIKYLKYGQKVISPVDFLIVNIDLTPDVLSMSLWRNGQAVKGRRFPYFL